MILSPKLQTYPHSSLFTHCSSLTLEEISFCQMLCVSLLLEPHHRSRFQKLHTIRNLLFSALSPTPPNLLLAREHAHCLLSYNIQDIRLTFSSYVLIFLFPITGSFLERNVSRVSLLLLNCSYKLCHSIQASSSTMHQNMLL